MGSGAANPLPSLDIGRSELLAVFNTETSQYAIATRPGATNTTVLRVETDTCTFAHCATLHDRWKRRENIACTDEFVVCADKRRIYVVFFDSLRQSLEYEFTTRFSHVDYNDRLEFVSVHATGSSIAVVLNNGRIYFWYAISRLIIEPI